MNRRILLNLGINESNLEIKNWKAVEVDLLSDKVKRAFLTRRTAIDLLIEGKLSIKEIEDIKGLKRQSIYRLIRRCILIHPDGDLYGYRALIPYSRIHNSIRINSIAGVLNSFPKVKEEIDSLILGKKGHPNIPKEKAISFLYIHKKFLNRCKKYGVSENEFPFTLKDNGLKSFQNYANRLLDNHFEQSVSRINDDAVKISIMTSKTSDSRKQPTDPFERVEFDGHKIDAYFTVGYKMNNGETTNTEISRIWILVVIDVVTRCILGYYVTLNPEYNSDDVIKTICNGLKKWEPKKITIPGINYAKGDGFPSTSNVESKDIRWQELYLDNGMANKSNRVKDFVVNKLHINYCLGPVGNPIRRPTVERFFKRLETELFHRLPSTTGSNPNDIKRQDPIGNAVKYDIKITEIEQLIDVWIAHYNNSPHKGLQNRTPLQVLKEHIDSGSLFSKYSEKELDELLLMSTTRNISGSNEKGIRPYINFENVRYSSDFLRQSTHLIGKKVLVKFNPDDIRKLKLYLFENGEELGTVKAQGTWGEEPHDLRLRKEVWKYGRKNLKYSNPEQVIESYRKYIIKKAKGNRKVRARVENKLKLRSEIECEDNNSLEKNETVIKKSKQRVDTNIDISTLPGSFITKGD